MEIRRGSTWARMFQQYPTIQSPKKIVVAMVENSSEAEVFPTSQSPSKSPLQISLQIPATLLPAQPLLQDTHTHHTPIEVSEESEGISNPILFIFPPIFKFTFDEKKVKDLVFRSRLLFAHVARLISHLPPPSFPFLSP